MIFDLCDSSLYIYKQVEVKTLQSVDCCSIDSFLSCYNKFLKSGSLNLWVDAYSHASSSRSFPFLKGCLFFHRHSLLLIKPSGMAKPANRASKRTVTVRCSLCGTPSVQAGKSMHRSGGEYNSSPTLLMLRRQQKIQGEKCTQLWPCRETTGEVAKLTLIHSEENVHLRGIARFACSYSRYWKKSHIFKVPWAFKSLGDLCFSSHLVRKEG